MSVFLAENCWINSSFVVNSVRHSTQEHSEKWFLHHLLYAPLLLNLMSKNIFKNIFLLVHPFALNLWSFSFLRPFGGGSNLAVRPPLEPCEMSHDLQHWMFCFRRYASGQSAWCVMHGGGGILFSGNTADTLVRVGRQLEQAAAICQHIGVQCSYRRRPAPYLSQHTTHEHANWLYLVTNRRFG